MSPAVHLFQFPNHNGEVNYKLLNLGLDGGDDNFIMKFEMKKLWCMWSACEAGVQTHEIFRSKPKLMEKVEIDWKPKIDWLDQLLRCILASTGITNIRSYV